MPTISPQLNQGKKNREDFISWLASLIPQGTMPNPPGMEYATPSTWQDAGKSILDLLVPQTEDTVMGLMKPTLKLFHGSGDIFNKFNMKNYGQYGGTLGIPGIYATPDENLAKIFGIYSGRKTKTPTLYELLVDPSNKYTMNIEDLIKYSEADGGVVNTLTEAEGKKLVNKLKKQKYDMIEVSPASKEFDDALGLQGEFNQPQYILLKPQKGIIKKIIDLSNDKTEY
jgi:hypothetical protein